MSGIKEPNVAAFYRSLNDRGLTISDLAEALNCGRSHLSQVINGSRSGKPTWRKIEEAEILTESEMTLLGRRGGFVDSSKTYPAPEGPEPCYVPRAAISHVEHEPQQVSA